MPAPRPAARTAADPTRDIGHLGDFTVGRRVLLIAALALPVRAVSAVVAWVLLRLIGLDDGWRRRLHPVLDPGGRLTGVVTRRELFAAALGDGTATLGHLVSPNPVVTDADQTLRHATTLMAEREVNHLVVVSRDDPHRVGGMVSLTQLLAGRLRDQQEARERERVLRVRLVRPAWTRALLS